MPTLVGSVEASGFLVDPQGGQFLELLVPDRGLETGDYLRVSGRI